MSILSVLLLILAVLAVPSIMLRTTAHITFPVVVLLLEVGSLDRLRLKLSLPFSLVLVGFEVLLLHHVGARTSLIAMTMCVLCSRLFFNIKSADQTGYSKLLSLVFQTTTTT